ncbi:CWF19-like protein 2 [Biomphalaria pfeifferi]|uniref:CWF19-like protein 2 n=1 Tax=Biomphalaria pfeifferi TaxID=112525 RepID=A0AAD8EW11_BIOPF|nr:CWF19-like protein 2 [Biomphalaria pfeifferi]
MSEKYSNFQSQFDLDAQKEENRKARQLILEQAKKKYEREEAKKEMAKKSGEGTWMLDSISQRIENDSKKLKKANKKKSKKEKKKKRQSSGLDEDEDAEMWVEKSPSNKNDSQLIEGPKIQRDSWMEAPLDILPTTSRQELRDVIKKQKDDANKEAERLLQPGQHARELNPYWKDGGSGLPSVTQNEKTVKKPENLLPLGHSAAGDGGLAWLRQALVRCKQQAVDEGRSLEEVAAERWGSLKTLQSMLAEAEVKHKGLRRGNGARESSRDTSQDERHQRNKEHSPDRRRQSPGRRRQSPDRRRQSPDRRRQSPGRRRQSPGRRRQSPDRRRQSPDRRRQSPERKTFSPDSGRDDHKDYNKRDTTKNEHNEKPRSRFQRPTSDDENEQDNSRNDVNKSSYSRGDSKRSPPRAMFQQPGSDSDEEAVKHSSRTLSVDNKERKKDERHSEIREERERRWKKSPDHVPKWKRTQPSEDKKVDNSETRLQKHRREITVSKKSLSPSSGSSSDSDSSSDHQKESPVASVQSSVAVKIPTEEELNQIAAKILRAEIMGDDSLAAELKDKLEKSRKLREESKSQGNDNVKDFSHTRKDLTGKGSTKRGGEEEEETDNVVVLSRTSKSGLVRPLAASSDQWGGGASKKRRKNAQTHDTAGQRTIYFDDDDKLDLKALVEQEKSGTAEDQNSMFARLAGKSNERDLDVDDMFVSKAAKKQDAERNATKERSSAIFEHKKMSSALKKCSRCLQKVPKHLIIALGTKSYLCLPDHCSLTEGHCLIVPMQHVVSATSMDEDVWKEMQSFRQCLVQMFQTQDQDVVFMETVMHLKHFPHTVLECVPLDREQGDLAPIYFKKAIQEVGPEWSDNKKLHSLKGKDVRHVIPKGFPYFSVDFGLEGGFATVIEDEIKFPAYFGREIVGGMIDAEPMLWRHPHKQSFEDQRQKVLKFEQMWKPFDWTQNLTSAD